MEKKKMIKQMCEQTTMHVWVHVCVCVCVCVCVRTYDVKHLSKGISSLAFPSAFFFTGLFPTDRRFLDDVERFVVGRFVFICFRHFRHVIH